MNGEGWWDYGHTVIKWRNLNSADYANIDVDECAVDCTYADGDNYQKENCMLTIGKCWENLPKTENMLNYIFVLQGNKDKFILP